MKKVFLQHWHYSLIIFPLLIFIYSIWDHNFYIGGDVLIPLNPLNNIQEIFLWDNDIGIESFRYAGFFWFAFYYLFSLIGISAFITQKILLVLLLIIGFTFTYLSYKELFRDTKFSDAKLAFLAAVIFTFNPIYFLLVNAYLPLYGFPVCFYFLIKFLQKGKILYAILFSVLLNFFFFIDLPQPKLLIVFGIACLFLALLYRQMRAISFKDISIRLIIIFSLSILLNLWVLIPLIYSLFFGVGASFARNLVTYGGDADFKTATLLYITRFFNYTIIKYYPHLGHFLTSPVFVIWTFTQWIILVSGIFFVAKDRKGQKIIYTLLITILLFIFIAKGSNPPLGQLYRCAIIHFPLARIFRTTSSVITGAVVFYAFLFSISTYYLSSLFRKKKAIVYIFIVLNIAIFYPLYFGYKFYNQIGNAPNQKGYSIPRQYYEMGSRLDGAKEDSKVLSIPLVRGYVNKNWHYFGPDILSWITKKPLIYKPAEYGLSEVPKEKLQIIPKNYKTYSLYNVGYLLLQKDTVGGDSYNKYKDLNPGALLIKNDYFDLYKIDDKYFLPHIYPSATPTIVSSDIEALVPMTETKHLDGKPVLVLSQQNQKSNIKNQNFLDINNFVFKDSNWWDLAIEMVGLEGWEIKEGDWKTEKTDEGESYLVWQERFKVKTPGIYEIFLDTENLSRDDISSFKIKVNDKELIQFKIPEKFYSKHIKIAQVEIEEVERYDIEVISNQETVTRERQKLILVNREEREKAEELIWKRMNEPKVEVAYIFGEEKGEFYLP